MTHKFATTHIEGQQKDKSLPILFKVIFKSGYYYLHKGKDLNESSERLLYDIFRGIVAYQNGKQLKLSEDILRVVDYCIRYPQINSVRLEVVFNGEPEKLLSIEKKEYNKGKKDPLCLNNFEVYPYTPEWMLRHKYAKRCEKCIKSGVVDDVKMKFIFCPKCGKSIK